MKLWETSLSKKKKKNPQCPKIQQAGSQNQTHASPQDPQAALTQNALLFRTSPFTAASVPSLFTSLSWPSPRWSTRGVSTPPGTTNTCEPPVPTCGKLPSPDSSQATADIRCPLSFLYCFCDTRALLSLISKFREPSPCTRERWEQHWHLLSVEQAAQFSPDR